MERRQSLKQEGHGQSSHPTMWHPAVTIEQFTSHVVSHVEIVDMTLSPKLCLFDKSTIKRAMGWGAYVEQVVHSLVESWKIKALELALDATFPTRNWSHRVTVPRLRQARRWVLSSMLGSAFLGDSPRPKVLLRWIMMEYASLPAVRCDGGGMPHVSQGGIVQSSDGSTCVSFGAFIEDAAEVMRSRAETAVLSHACSALRACSREEVAKQYSAKSRDRKFPYPGILSPHGGARTLSMQSGRWATHKNTHGFPSSYEISVETAQKRAYASNCYSVLLSKHIEDEARQQEGLPVSNLGSSERFLQEMGVLAQSDIIVLEILCLMLLEPWRIALIHSASAAKQKLRGWVEGAAQTAHRSGDSHSVVTSPTNKLLNQVLANKDDPRLWSLNLWLLLELSQGYHPFAEAYTAHLVQSMKILLEAEIEGVGALSQHLSGGLPSRAGVMGELEEELAYNMEETWNRLCALASRSSRLGRLCDKVMAENGLGST
ncbi:unnamed protein product [Discosporangium mesarthrocarpum]